MILEIFTGHDPRESIGWHAFTHSVLEHASCPVSFTALQNKHLGMPEGSNQFTFSRFLIPWLRNWEPGVVVFADGCDMLCRADIAELVALANPHMAVQVVKHDYETKHPIKYVGTSMECGNGDYPRKNWASLMLVNCGHFAWRSVTPEMVRRSRALDLLQLRFLPADRIGELPIEWNWLADEYGESADAKLLHWTAGIPAMPHYQRAPHAAEWFEGHRRANGLG